MSEVHWAIPRENRNTQWEDFRRAVEEDELMSEQDPAVELYQAQKAGASDEELQALKDKHGFEDGAPTEDLGFNYEHGTTDEEVLEADEPPKSGEWVDVHDVLANPTAEEVRDGLRQGESIDPEDDSDNEVS